MFVSPCLTINEQGHLAIGGMDTVALAGEYGTPVYVMDEVQIRQNCRDYVRSIEENYGGRGRVLYASKAMCCKELCRIMNEEGLGLDVVSGGELYTALQAGFPSERIYFHGNNKTEAELRQALDAGVGRIIVDNLTELKTLNDMASQRNRTAKIMFRIKPGIDAHTHSFIRTGQIDSKFGFALETGEALTAIQAAINSSHIKLCGLHCHIGSQIHDVEPFVLAAQVMIDLIARVRDLTGYTICELNLGGGFGIKYTTHEQAVPYADYMKKVSSAVKARCASHQLETPFILMEPGRSIVGDAGITLYTVGAVKDIPNVRTYLSVDGGMVDNPRYILYQSTYELLVANKAGEPKDFEVTVAGKCCESGDLIQENCHIQKAEPGDILAVLSTGAYNYSMASNYNRIPRPPVVMVNEKAARVIVRRESFEDLVRNDM